MKKLLSLWIASMCVMTYQSHAGTCTSITRSNAAANSILTSTQYNNDLNTVYSASNAFDGGCVTTGTLETDSLNTTQFSPVLNAIREGCKVTNTDTNTISVDRCIITVNSNFLKTTSATTVTWGCSGCSGETTSTEYYVYVNNSSTFGLTLSTTAPNGDGYNASSQRCIGRFFNDSSSNINGVEQFVNGSFTQPRSEVRVQAANGHGGTNTKIRRFTNTLLNIGTGITYTDSAANGATFTINEDGVYAISLSDSHSAAADTGISLNSSQLTTSIGGITAADRLAVGSANAAAIGLVIAWTGFLKATDVVRAHDDGTGDGTSAYVTMTVVKVSP